MNRISVDFQHWDCVLDSQTLTKYGSPHFSHKEAQQGLLAVLQATATKDSATVAGGNLEFSRAQFLSANEAFPEAAISDPLSDIELLAEWSAGVRCFPYPGYYHPLGIIGQEKKIAATSSVGVIGEIVAGLFSQVGIAPWILVRVVNRWPDFILYNKSFRRYEFVESKAYTVKPTTDTEKGAQCELPSRIDKKLLGEACEKAMQQLNADPWVRVWYCFTWLEHLAPLRLVVTLVSYDAEDSRRQSMPARSMPKAVLSGLAQRAIGLALVDFPDSLRSQPDATHKKDRDWVKELQAAITKKAEEKMEGVLAVEIPGVSIGSLRKDLDDELSARVSEIKSKRLERYNAFLEKREALSEGRYVHVRTVGTTMIAVSDLNLDERTALEKEWNVKWECVTRPYIRQDGPAWRCSTAAYRMHDSGSR